jgi:hypothetical protein
MHELPLVVQLPALANPNPSQGELAGGRKARLLAGLVAGILWFAALSVPSVSAPTPAAQDKPAEAPPTPDPATALVSQSTQVLDLSDEVVRDVLTDLQRGVETQNLARVMESFDPQNMKDFAQFREQMAAFFRRYDNVRFRYQLLQVSSDNGLGFAIADIDMDADPSDILPTPQRRSVQMRFQMKRGPKGWKVIGLQPADFFSQ